MADDDEIVTMGVSLPRWLKDAVDKASPGNRSELIRRALLDYLGYDPSEEQVAEAERVLARAKGKKGGRQ